METIVRDLNNKKIYVDELWINEVRKPFCHEGQNIRRTDRKYFSQLWQGFAWAAIIGFINDRSIPLGTDTKKDVFAYQVISNQAPRVADALILMAIAKSGRNYEILLEPNEISRILSEYAKGGAEYIKEIRETPGTENYFDNEDDFLNEIMDR